jgi:DNA-binding transcriptional LysR family regulator
VNTSQIKCFLAAAECLNFTKAAERLFLSQSGLSRQIASIEHEFGITLFERGRNSVYLTQAGSIFAAYLKKMEYDYHRMLDEALAAQRSQYDTLIIGGLEGQLVGACYEKALAFFWGNHPNIKIKMCYYNVSELCKALVEGDIDIGIMPEAEAERLPGILYKRSHMESCCLVIPRNHPMANKKNPTLQDFKDETFLVLAESDSDVIAGQHRRVCQEAGFTPKQRIVPTYGTLVMLLEMGVGISVLNVWHSLRNVPNLKFLKMTDVGNQIEAVAWHKDNKNPNIRIFLDHVDLDTQPAYDSI